MTRFIKYFQMPYRSRNMHVPGKQTEKIQPSLSQQKIVRIPGLENQYKNTNISHKYFISVINISL